MRFALFRREPDPDFLTVSHAGRTFDVAVRRRAAARRMTLRVSTTSGGVFLTLPSHVSIATARTFTEAHGGWIAKRLSALPNKIPFVPGAQVPLRGVMHRIVHSPEGRTPTQTAIGPDGEPILRVSGEAPHVARRIKEFLEREAKRDLTAAVARHTQALGIAAKRMTMRDTTSRWGSCSASRCLNFSWRLILAPPFVLDYLAAHEVSHLKEMNHSQKFWAVVAGLCTRVDEAEAWLKAKGSDLHRYG